MTSKELYVWDLYFGNGSRNFYDKKNIYTVIANTHNTYVAMVGRYGDI